MTVAPRFLRKIFERDLEPSEENGQIESFEDFTQRVCDLVENDDLINKSNCSIQFPNMNTAVVIWRGYDFNKKKEE